jgi:hypothetical protein
MKIAKNIPPPPKRLRLTEKIKQLGPGNSFFIVCGKSQWRKIRSNLSMTVKRINKSRETPISVTTRSDERGIRIWRIT